MAAEPIEITEPPQHEAVHGEGPEEGHTCGCAHDDAEIVLDVRTIPHAVRHGVVFGALEELAPGDGLVLVAPHDPLPLLAQLEGREPGAFDREYLSREATEVSIRLTRRPVPAQG
ncbi:DUF2249 domain-containing protein [Cellulosimicrobium cellulans]|uniref:DUF2249 domain-containing protein n=1 Tax=Cellulosimicrobium cellulans TaxID=1710 RepID=UPI0037F50043